MGGMAGVAARAAPRHYIRERPLYVNCHVLYSMCVWHLKGVCFWRGVCLQQGCVLLRGGCVL